MRSHDAISLNLEKRRLGNILLGERSSILLFFKNVAQKIMETIANLVRENQSFQRSTIGRRGIQVLSAIVGCAIVGFASAASAQIVLQQGDEGTAVSNLQDRLRALGCFDGSSTGFFGPQTREAVIRCQQQRGIDPDGVVGAETYRALGLGNPATGTGSAQFGDRLQLGDRGPGVRELQNQLRSRGYYYGTIDGVFGADTQTAVAQLQRDLGRPQTGEVDAEVYAALSGGVPTTSPIGGGLQLGDENSRVSELQRQLNQLGYSVPATGYFGSQTQQAVLSFQQAQALPATGVADPQTLAAIRNLTVGTNPTAPVNSRRYVVVIPFRDRGEFDQIRAVIQDAVPRQSRLGNFVRDGSYTTPEAADRRAGVLRARGLTDARVVFE